MKVQIFLIGKAKIDKKNRITMSIKLENHKLIGYKILSAEVHDDSLLVLLEEK